MRLTVIISYYKALDNLRLILKALSQQSCHDFEVIVSEDTGYQKPMIEFFEYTFAKIPNLNKAQTVIIGDSLSSDIQGGINAEIDTIWLRPDAPTTPLAIEPTHQIRQLEDLYSLLS